LEVVPGRAGQLKLIVFAGIPFGFLDGVLQQMGKINIEKLKQAYEGH
jgi:hypothetical protein